MNQDRNGIGGSKLALHAQRRKRLERLSWPAGKPTQSSFTHDDSTPSQQSDIPSQSIIWTQKSKDSIEPKSPKKIEIIEIDDSDDEILSPDPPKKKLQVQPTNYFGANLSFESSQSSTSRPIRHRKRPLSVSQKIIATKSSNNQLWIEKYAPTTNTAELCVAPKKVNETRDWLRNAWQKLRGVDQSPDLSKLLILVGSPGIGKSTMIQVLAKENNWSVLEYKDHFQYVQQSSNWDKSNELQDYLPNQSQLSIFEEFLRNAGSGYSGILSSEDNLSISGGKKFKNYTTTYNKNMQHDNGRLILIEEIPNIYSNDAAKEFRNIMTKHIRESLVPTVFIFSDVFEGKHRPEDLERLIDPSCLYSQLVKIIQCHPVTKPKMKKILQNIWRNENRSSGSFPDEFVDDLHMTNGGDLRNAILTFQFQYDATNQSMKRFREKSKHKASDETLMKPNQKNERLSTFHALGKLLYAKRKPGISRHKNGSFGKFSDNRQPLDFDPENVIENCTLDSGGSLAFLGFHSPDFFTDITELSDAFDLFSDAAFLDDKKYSTNRSSNDTLFPGGYVSSLTGRAVAHTNKHPTPNKFRKLNAPMVFEVMKKKRLNVIKMDQLKRRLSLSIDNHLPLNENISSSDVFITNTLPFLRNILPSEMNHALSTLHSYARPGQDDDQTSYLKEELDNQILKQQQILEDDDILDDESDSNDLESLSMKHPKSSKSTSGVSWKLNFTTTKNTKNKSTTPDAILID